MPRLDYHTAGESHGPCQTVLIQGVPAGLVIDEAFINGELSRRQGGYGRGARQKIETDVAEFQAGVRRGRTTGGPIVVRIINKDSRLDDAAKTPPVYRPRPGHADLAGSLKWLTTDCRDALERASARETSGRVAAGAIARLLLREIEVEVFGFVRSVGEAETAREVTASNWRELKSARDASAVYCFDSAVAAKIEEAIRQAKIDKDTVGGLVETHVFGCPPGLGTCVDWRDRLDARLAYAAMGIQAIKSVEIGLGKDVSRRPGSKVHDPIEYDANQRETNSVGFVRPTNNAGGIEGGMTNGAPVVVRAAMKPISTLLRGMPSVDLNTKRAETSAYERSDVCAVPAASVVLEHVVAFEIARAALEKYAGDTVMEFREAWRKHLEMARLLPLEPPSATIA
ncbi:MAG TPA: chorismate synthase [Phycisphaerales bacterium]|nr:chorismate synthase [Phycisphaerales bacterium]